MSESMFASLLHTQDRTGVSEIANSLGEPEESVARGMDSSIAAVLGGMLGKAEDTGALRKILDLIPGDSGEVSWSHLASGLSNPTSALIAGGKRVLSSLFGTSESTVMGAVSRECGLDPGTASTLLAIAAPTVVSFLNKRVRDERMSMTSLGAILQKERATIRGALPAGLSELFRPSSPAAGASPVIAQSFIREGGFPSWATALGLCGAALGCFWLLTHARRPVTEISSVATGAASRLADEASVWGDFVRQKLPNNVDLNVPASGIESRLLVFIQDSNAVVDQTSWFDFDRLKFDSGSATLRLESRAQLDNIAAILTAYPNVHVNIAAFTDSVGSGESNLKLSRVRADSVRTELVARGISPKRVTAQGFGEQNAAADNSTEGGRARNRRASLQVTQK
jgi:outer membrane protein OmpA-like peptidoglycan-associated protein